MRITDPRLLAVGLLALLTACAHTTTGSNPNPPPTTPGQVTMTAPTYGAKGVSYPVAATEPSGNAIKFSVDNASIATITATGNTTATLALIGTGTVTITAADAGGKDTAATASVTAVEWLLYDNGSLALFIKNADGSGNSTQITPASLQASNAEWMHLHHSIVAVAQNTNVTALLIISTGGKATDATVSKTISIPSLGGAQLPTGSPDEKTIAFVGYDSTTGKYGIYTIGSDGNNLSAALYVSEMPGNMGAALDQPRWNSTGTQICYNEVDPTNHSEIWVMDANGANKRQVSNDLNSQSGNCYWGPNDATIYFAKSVGGTPQIWRVDATATKAAGSLVKDNAYAVVVAPDGTKIAYRRGGTSDTYTSAPDGTGESSAPVLIGGYHISL